MYSTVVLEYIKLKSSVAPCPSGRVTRVASRSGRGRSSTPCYFCVIFDVRRDVSDPQLSPCNIELLNCHASNCVVNMRLRGFKFNLESALRFYSDTPPYPVPFIHTRSERRCRGRRSEAQTGARRRDPATRAARPSRTLRKSRRRPSIRPCRRRRAQ